MAVYLHMDCLVYKKKGEIPQITITHCVDIIVGNMNQIEVGGKF